ncbi:hypothetical protein H9655_21675 [Cytobacillus sp. Sa5YUA1]|uniref:AbrB C-terminal domain-containing protein n=1 Tax=Cytobacillus stercorigallinarum TaxID=2762240 RepID=A0ABR8QW55_9BACI|nr:hypothetical protein [Cytobacillus stercorigallinarum]
MSDDNVSLANGKIVLSRVAIQLIQSELKDYITVK